MTRIPESPTRLVLIRHGETVGNRRQLWTGWSDTSLSETGRDQVRRMAARLERDSLGAAALYSSPIGRARKTAASISQATRLPLILDDALKEMHFGELEAIRSEHFATDHPEIYARWRNREDESFGWPGGETRREFRHRAVGAIERLAAAHPGQTILLVTHSGFIRMALAHFAPRQFGEWWRVKMDNCSLTHLVLDGDGATQVSVFNDIAHIVRASQE